MRYRLTEIPLLLRTPVGQMQFRDGLLYRMWPVLSRLAMLHRRTLARRTRVVAVVGSFGKSTTTRAVAAALGVPLIPRFSYNHFSGIARAVLRIRPGQRHAVIEVGIDKTGQMAPYARVVRPDIAVVTCIGSEHHRSLGNREVTRHEKADMVRALPETGIAVLNGDDPNVLWMKSQTRARVVTFGFAETNDVRAADIRLDWPRGTRFALCAGGERREMTVPLFGQHMLLTALAAVAVARTEGLSWEKIIPPLEALPPVSGRMELLTLPNGAWILCDDRKSALETIHAALDVLAQIPARRRLIALGEVTEPLGSQGPIYRQIGERLAGIVSLAVAITTDKSRRSYAAGAERAGMERAAIVGTDGTILRATELLREKLQPGDVLLIKGRSDQRLQRIALGLSGHNVRCDIRSCKIKSMPCERCPMLERGWEGRQPIT